MKQVESPRLVQYTLYRRQVLAIRRLARETHRRPSEVLRVMVDQSLANNVNGLGFKITHTPDGAH